MTTSSDTLILTAERLSKGLVIRFSDGKCAFYSSLLLHAIFFRAEPLDETATAW